ncbi:MAG: lipocalin-like domain-containing protein [Ignavibacteriales bacterium]
MFKRFILITLLILAILASGVLLLNKDGSYSGIRTSISVSGALSGDDTAGYKRALAPKKFVFPRDYGPHPDYKTEWWYFTGNLETQEGRHFGFQLTIFRTAVSPDSLRGTSSWRSNQIYMGHFTLTDVESDQFYSFERFSRGANNLAGASPSPFKVWLENWLIDGSSGKTSRGIPEVHLMAEQNGVAIDLNLISLKPVVLQGNNGLSQKGPEPGNASYYYSLTRLNSSGRIKILDNNFEVKGLSWMDREWSTSALSKNQAGWDWFSLQLNNGTELMYYQMRKKDGNPDQFSRGIIVNNNGTTVPVAKEDVKLSITGKWQSPGGGSYPSGWRLRIPKEKIDLYITPYIPNQELNVSIHYWEGAVKITGISGGKSISGSGYVELTGYEKAL